MPGLILRREAVVVRRGGGKNPIGRAATAVGRRHVLIQAEFLVAMTTWARAALFFGVVGRVER